MSSYPAKLSAARARASIYLKVAFVAYSALGLAIIAGVIAVWPAS